MTEPRSDASAPASSSTAVVAPPAAAIAAISPTPSASLRRKRGRGAVGVWWWVGGIVLVSLFALPLLSAVTGSLKSPAELQQRPATFFPQTLSGDAWSRLFDPSQGTLTGLANSLVVAIGTVALTVVLSTLAGYGFGRFRFRGSTLLFGVVLAGMMIPFSVLLTPISVVLRTLGVSNSLLGLVLVYTTYQLPFCIFIMRNAFAAIPDEIEEAAMIDGCSRRSVLLRMFVPLVVPGIVTAAIFAFLNAWNEFLGALVLLSDQALFTLPVVLQTKQIGQFGKVDWGLLDAGVVVSMIPCLLIFFLLQRYYVDGIFSGAAK